MRAYEFIETYGALRKPKLTLRNLHQEKLRLRRCFLQNKERHALLPVMYGQDDYHQKQMDAFEREQARIETDTKRAKLTKARAEAEKAQSKSSEAISRMAKRTIKRRKRCRL